MIFDMSGLAAVKAGTATSFTQRLISRVEFHPPYPGWTNTFQPMFTRKLAWASDEDVQDNCKDAPKLVWLLDIQAETHPVIIFFFSSRRRHTRCLSDWSSDVCSSD